MTTTTQGLSGLDATLALARLSLKRVMRGKTLWVTLAVGLLPCLLAPLARSHNDDMIRAWENLLKFVIPLVAIIPPLLVTTSLSDEIDEKTSSYLWSRALPRWSVLTGKLLGLAPVAAFTIVLGLVAIWAILGGPGAVPSSLVGRTIAGVIAGTFAASIISAMFAAVAPRFAVPLAIGWLLLDSLVGAMSMNIHVIAVSFGPRAIADNENVTSGIISMLVISALAMVIALRRIERVE